MTRTLNYHALATMHRPQYRDEVARAVRDLAASGLKAHDIASVLGIASAAVSPLLGEPQISSRAIPNLPTGSALES